MKVLDIVLRIETKNFFDEYKKILTFSPNCYMIFLAVYIIHKIEYRDSFDIRTNSKL